MRLFTKRVIKDLNDTPYLIRWSLWLPFGWSIKLHKILLPDHDRCAHDHPWSFFRMVLRGGYWETQGTSNEEVYIAPFRPMWHPAWSGFRHRITMINGPASWSLVITGPKMFAWGFYNKSDEWKSFKDFDALGRNRVDWCEE